MRSPLLQIGGAVRVNCQLSFMIGPSSVNTPYVRRDQAVCNLMGSRFYITFCRSSQSIAIAFLWVLLAGGIPMLQPGAAAQHGNYMIVNGDIVLEGGRVLEAGILLIEEGRIVFTGKNVRVRDGRHEVIDATGKQVYPGFDHPSLYAGLLQPDSPEIDSESLSRILQEVCPIETGGKANLLIVKPRADSSQLIIDLIFIDGRIQSAESLESP